MENSIGTSNSKIQSENMSKSCTGSQKKSPFKFKKNKTINQCSAMSDNRSNFENNYNIIFKN